MNIFIGYVTYSGNTEEIAQLLSLFLKKQGSYVDLVDLTMEGGRTKLALDKYDFGFIGSFTWDYGAVPDEMNDFLFMNELPFHVAVFGSGDTQFGGEALYCRAVDELVVRLNSKWEGLKIEQSPRGSQEEKIIQWVKGVFHDGRTINSRKNVRTS